MSLVAVTDGTPPAEVTNTVPTGTLALEAGTPNVTSIATTMTMVPCHVWVHNTASNTPTTVPPKLVPTPSHTTTSIMNFTTTIHKVGGGMGDYYLHLK